jgi:hypothetical protein
MVKKIDPTSIEINRHRLREAQLKVITPAHTEAYDAVIGFVQERAKGRRPLQPSAHPRSG